MSVEERIEKLEEGLKNLESQTNLRLLMGGIAILIVAILSFFG